MTIQAKDFIDRFGRRVLTDGGQPGRDGKEGVGSTTEQLQGRVAAALLANCDRLDDAQLDEIIGWVAAYKSRASERRAALGEPTAYLWPSGALRTHAIDPISDPDLAGKEQPL